MKTLTKLLSSFLMVSLFVLLLPTDTTAQGVDREVGIRFSNLDNFGLLYKRKLKKEDAYVRYRLGGANFGYSENNGTSRFNTSLLFSMGQEKRKSWSDKATFLHGFEIQASFSFSQAGNSSSYTFGPGIGYALGMMYDLSDDFYLGIEINPSIQANFGRTNNGSTFTNVSARFTISTLALTAAYRFNR